WISCPIFLFASSDSALRFLARTFERDWDEREPILALRGGCIFRFIRNSLNSLPLRPPCEGLRLSIFSQALAPFRCSLLSQDDNATKPNRELRCAAAHRTLRSSKFARTSNHQPL